MVHTNLYQNPQGFAKNSSSISSHWRLKESSVGKALNLETNVSKRNQTFSVLVRDRRTRIWNFGVVFRLCWAQFAFPHGGRWS